MAQKSTKRRIDVLGSVNVDLVCSVERLPAPGETVAGGEMAVILGGKGANQAIAAARAGAQVAFWGAVGTQSFGIDPKAMIEAEGVDTTGLASIEGPTGAAMIAVDAKAENSIVVAPGANARAGDGMDVSALAGGWLLAQLETPPSLVSRAFAGAKARGAATILNAAPSLPTPDGLVDATDILIVNETELSAYAGTWIDGDAPFSAIVEAARPLLRREDQKIIVTLGARGALTISQDAIIETPAPSARLVDTTGAGDCFCGALVASLANGADIGRSLTFAAAAAAISVERAGASPSMPHREEILARMGD